MAAVVADSSRYLECAVASAIQPGETESGDRYLLKSYPESVLVAVVDGLGHGQQAAVPAQQAIDILAEYGHESVISMVRRCHQALIGTRGAVLSIASFNIRDHTMSWLGIGNVAGVLLRAAADATPQQESLIARGGVVGLQLPALHASVLTVEPGDTVVFATDGVRPQFSERLQADQQPQRIADHILAQYNRGTDDALVLVGRFLGAGQVTQ